MHGLLAGSWATLPQLLETQDLLGSYDIVLSAETIYSTCGQRQLLPCIKRVRSLMSCSCVSWRRPPGTHSEACHAQPDDCIVLHAVPEARDGESVDCGKDLLLWRGRRHCIIQAPGGRGWHLRGHHCSHSCRWGVQQARDPVAHIPTSFLRGHDSCFPSVSHTPRAPCLYHN